MIKTKRGDTLIEVTIAIGIFSMIAIAVASVMSSGTSGSQMALETTLAREEVDAQAEALRFVHSSYASSKRFEDSKNDYDLSDNPYRNIWGQIVQLVNKVTVGEEDDDLNASVQQFAPSTCDELYSNDQGEANPNSLFTQKGFILNLKQLSNPNEAVIASNDANRGGIFVPTTTYPHLIFNNGLQNNGSSSNSDSESLATTKQFNNVYQAAGIYIVGVQDPGTTNISGTKASAYYDFYIRTCWYGTDATRPSTISTVVRLYDPDVK